MTKTIKLVENPLDKQLKELKPGEQIEVFGEVIKIPKENLPVD